MGITRRRLIYSGLAAGGGLVVYSAARMLDTGGDGDARTKFAATTVDDIGLNAWIKIAPDGHITFGVHRAEMGQGVTTSLPMMLAEELDADWDRISYEFTPLDKDYYNFGVMGRGRPFGDAEGFFPDLGTALLRRVFHARGDSLTLSSTSILDAYDTLRPAGAAARALLVEAAARRWGVPAAALRTERSRVFDDTAQRSAGYGELVAAAAQLEPPADPQPKDPADYRIIGRSLPRLDIPAKVDGSAMFGIDIDLPDMLYGAVVHSPVAGGRIAAYDAGAAEQFPGVEAVLPLGEVAVCVLAHDTWTAMQAARQIVIETADDFELADSVELRNTFVAALDDPEPAVFRDDGEALTVLQDTPGQTRTYHWPYLAHATMEPMNCTALFDADANHLTMWVGSQAITTAQQVAAAQAGLDRSQVTVHRTLLGGGFGRRAEMDFVERAAAAAMQMPGRPLKITYSREQDMQHDMYRPMGVARVQAHVQDDGKILAMDYRLVTQSVVASFATRTPSPRPSDAAADKTVASGIYDLIYDVPNMRVAFSPQYPHVPVGYWRSTSVSYGAFVIESFMDELAHSAGIDPVEFRLANLAPDSRRRAVLELAAQKAGWGESLPAGRGRGVALFEKARTTIAQVVDVTVGAAGELSIDRIVCVADSGQVLHPDTVHAMMEGGMLYGVSAALYGEVTLEDGRVQQSNFHDYREQPMADMPEVEVYLLPQGGRPEGIGETAVPGVAPGIANAIFAATGRRIRTLPFGQRV